MVDTRKKKNQQKIQLSQLNGTLNDFVIGNGTNVSAIENETSKNRPNVVMIILKELLTAQVNTRS